MTKIDLICTGANLRAQVHGEITAGMRGIAVEISFDEAWQGLTPVLVVECSETFRKMAVDAAGRSSIPWECCISGEKLNVGVCGLNADGTVKLPTVWASCGRVLPSADDAQAEESSAPPTPTLLEQITDLANQAQAAAHAVTEAAQRGDFNGQDGTTPNIQIGNVATVSSGTPAAVRRRGTDESLVLDFDIPKGADGQDSGLVVAPESVTAPPPEVLPLDKTLSQPDQAAEALATGIAVGGLESRLSTLESKPQIPLSVELRLKKLEAAAEGNLYMFWEDDTEGCTKTVPDDVLRYATLDKIGGKTVVRNQTYIPQAIAGYAEVIDGAVHFYGAPDVKYAVVDNKHPLISGHRYLYNPNYSESENYQIGSTGAMVCIRYAKSFFATTAEEVIFTAQPEHIGFATLIAAGYDATGLIAKPTLIDLTQWFGADIADTITTPERAYELGVPREPIPYDAGTPVHADVESVELVGKNLLDIDAALRNWGVNFSRTGDAYTFTGIGNGYIKPYRLTDEPKRLILGAHIATDDVNTNPRIGLCYIDNNGSISARKSLRYTDKTISAENVNAVYIDYTSPGERTMSDIFVYEDTNDMAFKRYSMTSKPIPAAIRSLPGYGEAGAVVDFEQKIYTAPDGTQTDISALLPDGFENIEVEAGGTITFKQAGSLELPVPNQQTYMIKLGGGNT